jgi:hypothetical protein
MNYANKMVFDGIADEGGMSGWCWGDGVSRYSFYSSLNSPYTKLPFDCSIVESWRHI